MMKVKRENILRHTKLFATLPKHRSYFLHQTLHRYIIQFKYAVVDALVLVLPTPRVRAQVRPQSENDSQLASLYRMMVSVVTLIYI